MTIQSALVRGIGARTVDVFAEAGRFGLFLRSLAANVPAALHHPLHILRQAVFVGWRSLLLVAVTAVFVGGVTALQSGHQFRGIVPLVFIGTIITKAVFIEMGPVLTALVVGARISASFAAELGTMRVTEQIDALETMAIRPMRYLVVPRVIASVVMLPVLTVLANLIALLGGLIVAMERVGISAAMYTRGMRLMFDETELYGGLIKSFVFGLIMAIQGCYFGLNARGGAEGVGVATTKAVVATCVLVLVADYFLAELIFGVLFPGQGSG